MIQIPEPAQAIAKVIREQVPRPEELPTPMWMDKTCLRFKTERGWCCPLGLLPGTEEQAATHPNQFKNPPGSVTDIYDFVDFWDHETDPQAAVNAVWGEM